MLALALACENITKIHNSQPSSFVTFIVSITVLLFYSPVSPSSPVT